MAAGWKFGILVVFSVITANAAHGEEAETIRARLVPAIDETLFKICGSECTGFSVHPNVKGSSVTESGAVEDLGFEDISKKLPDAPKEISSVTIEVLTSKKMDPAIQETIKSTIAAVAKNHTDLPVTVRTKPVTLPPATLAKDNTPVTPKDWLDFAKHGLWPVALLLLCLLGLCGVAYVFRARRKHALLLLEAERAAKLTETASKPQDLLVVEKGPDLHIFSDRFDDLKFFLEDCAERGDIESLSKVIRLFPGDALSKNLNLSPIVPIMMTKAMSQSLKVDSEGGQVPQQLVQWLKNSLDKIHWKRLKENSEPISKVSGLTDPQLSSMFNQISSVKAKALVLSQINSDRWPRLLTSLTATQRVSVGSALSQIQQWGGQISGDVRKEVLESLDRVIRGSHLEDLVDDYVLFLSEEETTELSNQLSSTSGIMSRRKPVEEMILDLNEKELLELVLRLDVDQIRTLLENLPIEPQQKVLSGLPKKLKERVGFFASATKNTKQDPKWLQTRSRLFKLYNEVYAAGDGSRSVH
jgi:hypothetical protein